MSPIDSLGSPAYSRCVHPYGDRVRNVSLYYLKYAKIVDEKLRSGMLENSSMIYAAPRTVVAGSEAEDRGACILSTALRIL